MGYSKLYAIEVDGDIGDITTMRRLVRCRECRHAHGVAHADALGRWLLCGLQLYPEVKPDEFCAWGETEEDSSDDTD
jgi:hypothetical protein